MRTHFDNGRIQGREQRSGSVFRQGAKLPTLKPKVGIISIQFLRPNLRIKYKCCRTASLGDSKRSPSFVLFTTSTRSRSYVNSLSPNLFKALPTESSTLLFHKDGSPTSWPSTQIHSPWVRIHRLLR